MVTIKGSTTITRPVEDVFDLVADERNEVHTAADPAHEVASRSMWSSFQPTNANQAGSSSP